MLKRCLLFIVSLCCVGAYASDALSYTVIKNEYTFSAYFEMVGSEHYEGRVISNCFNVRTTYNLYDAKGNFEAQGICRAVSLGSAYDWGKEIDVYDVDGNSIGLIEGSVLTTAKAKFNFYDASKKLIGSAYQDNNGSGFTILSPDYNEVTLALLKPCSTNKACDDWDVILYDEDSFDSQLFKIFSAFLVDYQDSF